MVAAGALLVPDSAVLVPDSAVAEVLRVLARHGLAKVEDCELELCITKADGARFLVGSFVAPIAKTGDAAAGRNVVAISARQRPPRVRPL